MTRNVVKIIAVILFLAQGSGLYAKDLIHVPAEQNNVPVISGAYQPVTSNSSAEMRQRLSKYSKSAISGTLNQALLKSESKQLIIGLPGQNDVKAVQNTYSTPGENHSKWIGEVSGDPDSSVLITTYNGVSIGRISTSGRVYQLKPGINREYIIEELDMRAFPQCGNDDQGIPELRTLDNSSMPDAFTGAAGPVIMDLLAVYTPAARDKYGGHANIQALIQAAVDNANLAFTNSNMDIMFELVHMAQVDHNEGPSSVDLPWLRDDPDVKNLRNQVAADMVSLITSGDSDNFCGRGYVQRNPGPGFENSAVQVTAADCAVGNLSFAHEHGHNMGFEHDPANGISPSNASFPYSFGHYVDGFYRTVMSYSSPCAGGCPRVAHFSNPDINYAGIPTGIANQRDNARTGRFTAAIIANFRQPPVPGANNADDDFLLLLLPAIIQGANQSN